MVVKIPGLAHEFRTELIQGKNYLILSIKRTKPFPTTDELSRAVIYSNSAQDVENSLVECLRTAEIVHQVPQNIIKRLTDNIIEDSGLSIKATRKTAFDEQMQEQKQFQSEITQLFAGFQKSDENFKLELNKKLNQITYNSDELTSELDKILRNQATLTDLPDSIQNLNNDVQKLKDDMQKILSKISETNQMITQAGQKKGWFKS